MKRFLTRVNENNGLEHNADAKGKLIITSVVESVVEEEKRKEIKRPLTTLKWEKKITKKLACNTNSCNQEWCKLPAT